MVETSLVPLDSEAAQHAVEVAPRIWWVGDVLVGDPFQCHAYLIEAGEESMLIDPGSSLTIEATLRKVVEVVPLDHIKWIVLHHSDPDVADSLHRLSDVLPRSDVQVITEWRSALLLRHFAARFPFVSIEDLGWRFTFADGRVLEFLLTAYLHFPGAFVTYERDHAVLFSADLFGGFNRANRLWASTEADFEDLRQFHEHYMPSRDILMAGLATIRGAFPLIDRVLPQHGYLIPHRLVSDMFDQLAKLECGVMLISQRDTHLARLLTIAAGVRRIEDILDLPTPLGEMVPPISAELSEFMPLEEFWVEVLDSHGGIVRFDEREVTGIGLDRWTEPADTVTVLELPGGQAEGHTRLAIVLRTRQHWELAPEFSVLFSMMAARARKAVEEALRNREAHLTALHLRDEATHDPLTGLLNRRALLVARQFAGDAAVLMIDIDHFKQVNDRYGHPVGDRVLRAVADAVVSSVRRSDTVIRYGGEEILAIAELDPSVPAVDAATALADRIRQSVASISAAPLGADSSVTVSVGAALIAPDTPLAEIVRRADEALYRAKSAGRNRVHLHD